MNRKRKLGILAGVLVAVAASLAIFRAPLRLRLDRLCSSDRDCVRARVGKLSEVVASHGRQRAEERLRATVPLGEQRTLPGVTPSEACVRYQCQTILLPGGPGY